MSNNKPKLIVDNPKDVLKTYSSVTLLGNVLIALSGCILTAIGILTVNPTYIFLLFVASNLFGFIGRFIKQDMSDRTDAPTGFQAVSIRFFKYVMNSIKEQLNKLKGLFKRS